MKLKDIIKKSTLQTKIINPLNFFVKGISIHSDQVRNNFIFAAMKGGAHHGLDFIKDLFSYKNIAVVLSKGDKIPQDFRKSNSVAFIQVDDVRLFISKACSIFFQNSIKQKIAITGTNGKTSISFYVNQIWRKKNIDGASIGTLGVQYKKKLDMISKLTTPDVIDNHKILKKLSELGCEKVIFEASSIGLDQKRLSPIKFDIVGFTNLTNDHLDYHKTMNNYKSAKSLLFTSHIKKKTIAVINTDSKFSNFFLKLCKKNNMQILDYGRKASFLKIKSIRRVNKIFEVNIFFCNKDITLKINCCAEFEIYNMLCSLILVFNKKLKTSDLQIISKLKNPSGRLEKIFDKKNIRVFIDYAHSPDAITKVLSSLKKITSGKLIIVFGCGGDRDKLKRNQMTREALKYSDIIIITDDNPRFEDPRKIRDDMIRNLKSEDLKKIKVIGNREIAIKKAVNFLSEQDVLLIAGKGHENYQLIKNKKKFFSDKIIAKEYLKKK